LSIGDNCWSTWMTCTSLLPGSGYFAVRGNARQDGRRICGSFFSACSNPVSNADKTQLCASRPHRGGCCFIHSASCGAPMRQDCIETSAKSEVVTVSSWQFIGEERLQSTAMILITTGEPRRSDSAADRMTYRCLSCCSLTGSAGGKILSYIARASRIRRARSRSDFGINRITSPIVAPNFS
jgi:hypothetical protein